MEEGVSIAPERNLWSSVVRIAFDDLMKYDTVAQQSKAWIGSRDFEEICGLLGLKMAPLREEAESRFRGRRVRQPKRRIRHYPEGRARKTPNEVRDAPTKETHD